MKTILNYNLFEAKKKAKECKDEKECKDGKEEKKVSKVGLTPGQKKLPEALQKAILAKQKKSKKKVNEDVEFEDEENLELEASEVICDFLGTVLPEEEDCETLAMELIEELEENGFEICEKEESEEIEELEDLEESDEDEDSTIRKFEED